MQNINIRAYIAVLVFALILAGVVAFGIWQNWGVFRRPVTERDFNADVFNEEALGEGQIGMAGVDVVLTLLPPSSSAERRQLNVEISELVYYVRDDHPELDVVEACLTRVDMGINLDDPDHSQGYAFLDEPACIEPDEESFVEEAVDFDGISIDRYYALSFPFETPAVYELTDADMISQNFWYPFDGFTFKALVGVEYELLLSDDTLLTGSIRPYMQWDIQTSGTRLWDVRLETNVRTVEEGTEVANLWTPGTYDEMTFAFTRPLLYRLVMPFFIILMVFLIALVPLLGDRDTLVDICAAMLFGIFGLKGILGPGEQMGQTLLDISLIGLYVVLAFAAALFFVNKIIARRREAVGKQS
jgi:hypothetical protein